MWVRGRGVSSPGRRLAGVMFTEVTASRQVGEFDAGARSVFSLRAHPAPRGRPARSLWRRCHAARRRVTGVDRGPHEARVDARDVTEALRHGV